MFGSNRIVRYIVIAAMILAGVSFIALIMSSFDVETEKLITELLAVLILLVVLMAAAFLTALVLRVVQNRRRRMERRDEQDED